ncbi:MAG: sigma-70 family RNA polymerase sigma factor [Thermoguttaceae bacterium]
MSIGHLEAELLTQAVRGDREALSQLLLLHYDHLQQHIERRLPDDLRRHVAADDILHQAMVRAAGAIGQYEPRHENAFLGWLKTIADNLVRDARKKKERQRRAGSHDGDGHGSSWVALVEKIAGQGSTPSGNAVQGDNARRLRAALAALPDDYREVIQRHYLLDQPLQQVALAMGGTKGSVRAMCYRARKRLRELMGRSSMYFSG